MHKVLYLVVLGVVSSISLSFGYGIKRYPSNRMLDFNWPDPDEHIKKFPHERYCHYYYQKQTDEIFTIRKCPAGEMFDYHSHECKEKHTAECWGHHYGKHAVHDHIHSKWRKHFKCPFPNGNYPDIFDCDKYIVCLDGKPHHKHCPPNQQFDKIRRHCVYAAFCANSTDAALLTHMCPYSSGNFAHLEDCSKYYNCHKSEPTVKTCEKNKLFDEEDRECKDKEVVDCKDRPNPFGVTSTNKLNVKSVATDELHPSVSSANIEINTADTEIVESTNQPGATDNFVMIDKVSMIKGKATAESNQQVGEKETSTVAQSDVTSNSFVSMSSKNITESTTQFTGTENSPSSMPSFNTAESTVKSTATDNSYSTLSSANLVQSTAAATKTQH
ncbi:uncharacterized protein [Parasteatoda tepidariorum]|uniref:uncharacterized protein isoform X1 n=2 Tax=Parasteatoda tepidariorum TaxID=114398 RepID=UPI001C71E361|nr:uncharacterized protein LOC107441190 isoform X1 [Parasteatoda tepidariorum]